MDSWKDSGRASHGASKIHANRDRNDEINIERIIAIFAGMIYSATSSLKCGFRIEFAALRYIRMNRPKADYT